MQTDNDGINTQHYVCTYLPTVVFKQLLCLPHICTTI